MKFFKYNIDIFTTFILLKKTNFAYSVYKFKGIKCNEINNSLSAVVISSKVIIRK